MGKDITKDWVKLQIKKSAERHLKIKSFWALVSFVLTPILGFLFGCYFALDTRVDGLSVLVQELATKIQFVLCK